MCRTTGIIFCSLLLLALLVYIHTAAQLKLRIKSLLISSKMLWHPQLFLDSSVSSCLFNINAALKNWPFTRSWCVHGVGWIYESITLAWTQLFKQLRLRTYQSQWQWVRRKLAFPHNKLELYDVIVTFASDVILSLTSKQSFAYYI